MVVRDTPSTLHDLITSRILNYLVLVYDIAAVQLTVRQGKVHVDGRASLVQLRHPEGDPDLLLVEAGKLGLVTDALVNALAELRDIGPGATRLK